MKNELINKLPHGKDFLFVDEIIEVSTRKIIGSYTFPEDDFYVGSHFKNNPIVPGVLITEAATQIGLGCFGIFLLEQANEKATHFVLTASSMDFLKALKPGKSISVEAESIYFRFYKLKVNVRIYSANQLIAKGILEGMAVN